MSRVFRNTRAKLLGETKISGYLLYALGEVILVVIGILFALQINNWNEARNIRALNRILLLQLQEENQSNINVLMQDKASQDTIISTISGFMNFLRTDMDPLDTLRLRKYLAGLSSTTSYSFSENYLLSYINANQREQTELSRQLVELHSRQEDLHYISEKNLEDRLENYFGYLEETIDFYDLTIKDYSIFSTLKFRNRIAMIMALESECNKQFFNTLEKQKTVDSLLRAYLEEE
jgi:hypothetical protein